MSKGFKKTPPKPVDEMTGEEISRNLDKQDIWPEGEGPHFTDFEKQPDGSLEARLIGSFSSDLTVGQGPDEEEQERLRVQLRDIANPPQEETGTGEAAASQNPNFVTAATGLHHGYPPHSPGEGIQGGLEPLPDYQRLNGLKPSVGRIVLFASQEYPEPQPALITKVLDGTLVNLHVLRDLKSSIPAAKVSLGEPEAWSERRWFWPPRA